MRIVKRVMLFVLAEILCVFVFLTAFVRIGTYLSTDHLRSGIVTGIRYDDGHPYETVLNLFGKEIRHTYKPKPAYLLEIRDGEKLDIWRVSREEALKYSVGDYVAK